MMWNLMFVHKNIMFYAPRPYSDVRAVATILFEEEVLAVRLLLRELTVGPVSRQLGLRTCDAGACCHQCQVHHSYTQFGGTVISRFERNLTQPGSNTIPWSSTFFGLSPFSGLNSASKSIFPLGTNSSSGTEAIPLHRQLMASVKHIMTQQPHRRSSNVQKHFSPSSVFVEDTNLQRLAKERITVLRYRCCAVFALRLLGWKSTPQGQFKHMCCNRTTWWVAPNLCGDLDLLPRGKRTQHRPTEGAFPQGWTKFFACCLLTLA